VCESSVSSLESNSCKRYIYYISSSGDMFGGVRVNPVVNVSDDDDNAAARNTRSSSTIYLFFQRIFGKYFPAVTFVSLLLLFVGMVAVADFVPSLFENAGPAPVNEPPKPAVEETPPVALVDSTLQPTSPVSDHHPRQSNDHYSLLLYSLGFYFFILTIRSCARLNRIPTRLLPFTRGDLTSGQTDGLINSFFSQMRFTNRMDPVAIETMRNRLRIGLSNRDFNGNDYELLQALDSPMNRGVSQNAIDRLPLHTVSAAEADATAANGQGFGSCPICLEPYAAEDEVRTVMCIHNFHKKCIDPWLRSNKTCPVCKGDAVQEI
jgi:hypothetical protein